MILSTTHRGNLLFAESLDIMSDHTPFVLFIGYNLAGALPIRVIAECVDALVICEDECVRPARR